MLFSSCNNKTKICISQFSLRKLLCAHPNHVALSQLSERQLISWTYFTHALTFLYAFTTSLVVIKIYCLHLSLYMNGIILYAFFCNLTFSFNIMLLTAFYVVNIALTLLFHNLWNPILFHNIFTLTTLWFI